MLAALDIYGDRIVAEGLRVAVGQVEREMDPMWPVIVGTKVSHDLVIRLLTRGRSQTLGKDWRALVRLPGKIGNCLVVDWRQFKEAHMVDPVNADIVCIAVA